MGGCHLRSSSGRRSVFPAVPVKAECLDLVECDDQLRPAQIEHDRLRFRFRLFGGLEMKWTMNLASFPEEDGLHIELWPDIPHCRWKRFWLTIQSDLARPAYQYAIYRRSRHGYYEPQVAFGGAQDRLDG